MGGELGVPEEKFAALADYRDSEFFDDRERTALDYADGMTITGREVDDELFARLGEWFDQDAIVELTAIIAWENASSKFNRALRVPSQQLVEVSKAKRAQRHTHDADGG